MQLQLHAPFARPAAVRCMLGMLSSTRSVSRSASRALQNVHVPSVESPKMQSETAYVRYKPDSDNLTISLVLGGRQRNLNRPADEPLEKPFTRIRANLAPAKDKRNKKQKKTDVAEAAADVQEQQQEVFVGLFRDPEATQPFDLSTPNAQAWLSAALLRVGDIDFQLCINPPTVDTLSLQAFPMVGYPLLPTVSYSFADPASSKWRWFRRQQHKDQQHKAAAAAGAAAGSAGWEDTGCASMGYVPTQADLGCVLRVECTPGAGAGSKQQQQQQQQASAVNGDLVYGEAVTAETGPVRSGPQQTAARVRALSPGVPLAEPWRLRVMSYNILADQYAGTAYAQQVLFKYCPTELLDNNYRRQLVLEEIQRYQPDICCLQEVDDKVFAEYLSPHLALAGFSGHYTNKQGKVREGSAMFWREDKWGLAAVQDVMLRDVFKRPLSARHAQFADMLDASPDLEHALQKVATIAQMVLLVPRAAAAAAAAAVGSNGSSAAAGSGSNGSSDGLVGAPAPVLMINTHLFFHPYAPHIRTLHTAAILEEAAAAVAALQQQQQQQQQGGESAAAAPEGFTKVDQTLLQQLGSLPPPTVVFCGDLNSDLNDGVPGVIELLQTGHLAADHWDWKMGAAFKWGKEEEEYADKEQQQQQQQQQQDGGASGQQQHQQQVDEGGAGGQQQQQQQQVLADGHDFDPPAESPTKAVPLYGKDVSIPFVLRSADDLATPYTNYTSGYKALLDYVWYDPKRLTVTRQLPQPSEHLLSSFIPSPNFPSDHLAVVYDLAFKPQAAAAAAAAAAMAAAAAGSSEPSRHASGAFTLLPASEDHVADAVAALQRGEVVAMPTDTLYGLAAAAGDTAAVQQLRRIKQRGSQAPFAVAVADVADVSSYCCTDQLPPGLLAALLPGPVTVLLPRRSDAAAAALAEGVFGPGRMNAAGGPAAAAAAADSSTTAADDDMGAAVVGVRVVPNEFVRRVCTGLGGGIALTSANLSGAESSLCTADFRDLWQYCGAVFDGGRVPVPSNQGSTVVDLTAVTTQQQQQQQQQAAGDAQGSGFRIVRAGVAAESVVELLTKTFGLKQLE